VKWEHEMKYLYLIVILMQPEASFSNEVMHPCEQNENWKMNSNNRQPWMQQFKKLITRPESSVESFSEAIDLKKMSGLLKDGSYESEFSEYWIGRIFFQLELYPLAYDFFLSSSRHSKYVEIRKASSECMKKTLKNIPDWNENLQDSDGIWKPENRDLQLLLAGRAAYSRGNFPETIEFLLKIDKKSNLEIDALNDLTWAFLMNKQYAEAIGIALQLRSGPLKNTFSPESMMVAAMALNEICSYPEALKMIKMMVNEYEPAFSWLNNHEETADFYNEIILGLKGNSGVPIKIRSEWIKSPYFIVRQQEMNLLIRNQRKIAEIPNKIRAIRNEMISKNTALVKSVIEEIKKTGFVTKNHNEKLPLKVMTIKKSVRKLVRFNRNSRILVNALSKYDLKIIKDRKRLINLVNHDLKRKNKTMHSQLKHVRENSDLIEVEILHGASRDLLGRKSGLKADARTPKFESTAAWNWGRFPSSELEKAEIWEDELGAVKADIVNHCQ